MTLKAVRFTSPPKERAQLEKGREGGGVGQSLAATRENSSPGHRASNGNLDEIANKTENTENTVFQSLRKCSKKKRTVDCMRDTGPSVGRSK